jgi:pyrimidine nucleoside transport protein
LKPIGKAFDKVWKYRSVPVLRWNSYQTIFQNDNNWFRLARYGFYLVLIVGLLTFLIIDTADERMRLQSFGGLFIFLVLGWIFSKYPSRVTCRIFL